MLRVNEVLRFEDTPHRLIPEGKVATKHKTQNTKRNEKEQTERKEETRRDSDSRTQGMYISMKTSFFLNSKKYILEHIARA